MTDSFRETLDALLALSAENTKHINAMMQRQEAQEREAIQRQEAQEREAMQRQEAQDREAIQRQEAQDREAIQRQEKRDREAIQRQEKRDREAIQRQEKRDRDVQEIRAMFKKTDEKIAVMSAKIEENGRQLEESKRLLDYVTKKLENMGVIQGEFAEQSILESIEGDLAGYGIKVDDVEDHVSRSLGDITMEYDIVAINGNTVVVIEVKNKMQKGYITKFVKKQLPLFKTLFPEYQEYTVYGGVGAMVFDKKLEKEAQDLGLFVFGQKGNTIALHNDPGFIPKAF